MLTFSVFGRLLCSLMVISIVSAQVLVTLNLTLPHPEHEE
jgi:hypothetical protein